MSPVLLVVEDDPLQREVIRALLDAALPGGATVCEAGTVAGAAAWLASNRADAVLLDLGLPDAEGMDALRAVQRAAPGTPVVVLTAKDEEHALDAINRGAQDYLTKSEVTAELLGRSVRHAIERSRAEALEAARLRAIVATQQALALAPRETDVVLNLVSEQAQLLTGADGAGVDTVDGDELVFRAATGSISDFVGTRVPLSASLSGLAYRTGRVHQCEDAHTDPHVDRALAEHMGARSFVFVPLVPESGRAVGVLKVVAARPGSFDERDVSALQLIAGAVAAHLEQLHDIDEKQRLLEELEAANSDLSEFAYVAAHDLKSPLVVMAGFAELLETGARDADPNVREWAAAIRTSARRMGELVDDLLAYCRVGTEAQRRERIDLGAVVARVVADLALAPEAVEADALPTVTGDPGMVAQLLQNLLTNAVKFVPPDRDPHVAIDAERDGRWWRLRVRDNGIGIAAEDRERVFGMFTRLHDRSVYQGTGIGLAICRRVVERHGGTIAVESSSPTGTTVTFTLPE